MRTTIFLSLAILLPMSGSGAFAQAQSCGDLWYRRNAVYKSAGYCFKTARAIQVFGNAGCAFDSMNDVPLSPVQHRIVADIIAQEQAWGCRD